MCSDCSEEQTAAGLAIKTDFWFNLQIVLSFYSSVIHNEEVNMAASADANERCTDWFGKLNGEKPTELADFRKHRVQIL